jgi:hypothetical protein
VMHPDADPPPLREIERIREGLPEGVSVYVGGALPPGELPAGVVWLENVSSLTWALRAAAVAEMP